MRKKLLLSRSGFEKPESREEAIMQNILGASNVLEPSESNIEEILKSILYNTPYTKEAEFEIEKILLAIKNNGTYTGECESRDMKILFAILNESTYNEEAESRIEELFIEWLYQRSSIKVLEGVTPLTFTSLGLPLINYLIEGNTVQNGTPTSSNPVSIQGVGELDSGEYRIPISSGGVTTNIYLGSTQTVRQIRKLVLTGEETGWFLSGTNSYGIANFGLPNALESFVSNNPVCSHFVYQTTLQNDTKTEGIFTNAQLSLYIRVYAADLPNKTAFVNWLKAQYANGTPVTLYYVLATPQTATVNEPLQKIGVYADTISMEQAGVEIPTVTGSNILDVDTTVKPSNIYIEYK